MNIKQTLQAAFTAARARVADIDKEIHALDETVRRAPQTRQALSDEKQCLIAMLPGVPLFGVPDAPTLAPIAIVSPEDEQRTLRNRKMVATYRSRYKEADRAKVDDIIARGGELDIREIKVALGEVADARGILPRNQLIPAMLRFMECREDRGPDHNQHPRWFAPPPKPQ